MSKTTKNYAENALSPTGKVHIAVRHGNSHYLKCNSWFNLAIEGWADDWKMTFKDITCRHCLRLRDTGNKVWKITYSTNVTTDLQPAGPAKTVYLVAPNRKEAGLLFGLNMPEDCAHPRNKLEQVSMEELLKEKRML